MLSKEIKKAAKEIAGRKYKNDELLAFASRIAEAQIDLWRAREARHHLFVTRLTDPYFDSTANAVMKGSLLAEILAPEAPNVSMAAVEKILNDRPQGAEKFAVIITDFKDLRKR